MPRPMSESDSKELLAPFGIPFAPEVSIGARGEADAAAERVGFPLAAKLCGQGIAHKTERGLVRLGIANAADLAAAVDDLFSAATPADGDVSVLIAPMIAGNRELICGMSIDPTFGPTVMVGIGGIMAEALADVAVRLCPLSRADAHDMLDQLRHQSILGEFRGDGAIDREAVVDVLMALADLASQRPDIVSVDLNPLVISDGRPVAVDALVETAT